MFSSQYCPPDVMSLLVRPVPKCVSFTCNIRLLSAPHFLVVHSNKTSSLWVCAFQSFFYHVAWEASTLPTIRLKLFATLVGADEPGLVWSQRHRSTRKGQRSSARSPAVLWSWRHRVRIASRNTIHEMTFDIDTVMPLNGTKGSPRCWMKTLDRSSISAMMLPTSLDFPIPSDRSAEREKRRLSWWLLPTWAQTKPVQNMKQIFDKSREMQ